MKIRKHYCISIWLLLIVLVVGCQINSEKSSQMKESHEEIKNTDIEVEEISPDLLNAYIGLGVDVEKGIPEGLKPGNMAPMFKAKDHDGNLIDLEGMLKDGPVILQFYRGQWCPVCSRYLSAFQDSVSLLEAKGARVIAVTPETFDNAKIAVESFPINYPVISDTDHHIMNAYKVTFRVTDNYSERIKKGLNADIAENNGNDEAFLPVPATYIINQDKTIGYVQFDIDYKKRASVENLLENL